MKTTFRARQPYADIFYKCAEESVCMSPVRPERFIEKMKCNKGAVGAITGMGLDETGLERKNPVIVALGDSVTAGHFESLLPKDPIQAARLLERAVQAANTGDWTDAELQKYMWNNTEADLSHGYPPIEITDSRESYIEKFKNKLIDKYEMTSVSVINAGIAGDNLIQMLKRSDRDVIRYQPDLVLINGSLNWDDAMGTTEEYKELLRRLVKKIQEETEADIILLTPNGDLPNFMNGPDAPVPTTAERVTAIRELANEEQVCLADVYAIWEAAGNEGCPWEELLANGINHPGVEGHEVYAMTLMKLFE
ncbi:MAG: SGNH/GDSL hydrolase family protein [Dorea sp.]